LNEGLVARPKSEDDWTAELERRVAEEIRKDVEGQGQKIGTEAQAENRSEGRAGRLAGDASRR